jgi:uncharacterized protein (TIGR03118 family)
MVISCSDDNNLSPSDKNNEFKQVNLVSDTNKFHPRHIDTNLVNAWGITTGNRCTEIFIAANHTGKVVVYDNDGNLKSNPIIIPGRDSGTIGSPTGLAYDTTASFIIPCVNKASRLIAASEDGIITAWSSGDSAVIVATGDKDAVYKGIALVTDAGSPFICAANFKQQKIEVFDGNFIKINGKPFVDNQIPTDFGPFNIQEIKGLLYVTYAKRAPPDFMDDEPGAGNGFVDVFTTDGAFIKRFASQGTLNSPWGIVKAPKHFDSFSNAILIGNFGDGRVNAFDESGKFLGQLEIENGTAVEIDGLWSLYFLTRDVFSSVEKKQLYFTAGPDAENHGLFGYLKVE